MFEFLRKGLMFFESMLKVPIRSVKNIVGEKNSRVKETAAITEDLIGLPFKMARQALDRAEGKKVECLECGGPTFKNITVKPEVSVISEEVIPEGYFIRKLVLHVTGLLCDA